MSVVTGHPVGPGGSHLSDPSHEGERPAARISQVPSGDQEVVHSRVLWVNMKTGVAHIYRECEYLEKWFEIDMVRERGIRLVPGTRPRLRYCSACVSELIVEATLDQIKPMLS